MKTNLLYFREAEISVCHLLWIYAPQFDQLDSKSAAERNTSEARARWSDRTFVGVYNYWLYKYEGYRAPVP